MEYKRVCGNCPISSCGAKYLVILANHLADVHQLDHIQRRQYLQEAKLQPKVKVVVYESEANNSGKNQYHNPVQTQETGGGHCNNTRDTQKHILSTGVMIKMQCNALNIKTVAKKVWLYLFAELRGRGTREL